MTFRRSPDVISQVKNAVRMLHKYKKNNSSLRRNVIIDLFLFTLVKAISLKEMCTNDKKNTDVNTSFPSLFSWDLIGDNY